METIQCPVDNTPEFKTCKKCKECALAHAWAQKKPSLYKRAIASIKRYLVDSLNRL